MTGQQSADDPEETTTDNPETADEQESADRGHLDDVDEGTSSAHREHLDGVEDGCGCTEIWEHLSENREEPADD